MTAREITVLLAAYNGARFLPEQLESLRGQTDGAFRVLMRDDGSTDGTGALLARAAEDLRFAVLPEEEKHLGAAGSFLTLLQLARTPYAALCDQDDVWAPERLSRCRAAMEAAEAKWGADCPILVHSDCALMDGEGRPIAPSFFRRQGWRGDAVSLPELLVQNNVTGCTVLLNRPLAELAGRADPAAVEMHDWFLAQTAAAFGHIVFLPEALVSYRQHGDNAIGASRRSLPGRVAEALRTPEKARARIALTYRRAAFLLETYGDTLPEGQRETIRAYLATEHMPRLQRIRAVMKGGYRMQSPWARMGQRIFG